MNSGPQSVAIREVGGILKDLPEIQPEKGSVKHIQLAVTHIQHPSHTINSLLSTIGAEVIEKMEKNCPIYYWTMNI